MSAPGAEGRAAPERQAAAERDRAIERVAQRGPAGGAAVPLLAAAGIGAGLLARGADMVALLPLVALGAASALLVIYFRRYLRALDDRDDLLEALSAERRVHAGPGPTPEGDAGDGERQDSMAAATDALIAAVRERFAAEPPPWLPRRSGPPRGRPGIERVREALGTWPGGDTWPPTEDAVADVLRIGTRTVRLYLHEAKTTWQAELDRAVQGRQAELDRAAQGRQAATERATTRQ